MSPATVTDRWTGTLPRDEVIVRPPDAEDGWHPCAHRLAFEHWYFDARLDDGHLVVGFLQDSELVTKKAGVELHVYKPDGTRIEIRKYYPHSAVRAATTGCQVEVGHNHVTTDYSGERPVYQLHLEEDGVRFDLQFSGDVPPWRPGLGRTDYGERDFFAWHVGAPRATVTGTIAYEGKEIEVTGVGYHDHNWGIGDMRKIIDHWYWGRIYAEDFTCVYAQVTTTPKFAGVTSQPLMIAHHDEIILSTGEVQVEPGPMVFDEVANREYPTSLRITSGEHWSLELQVQEIIHAHNILNDFPVVRSGLVQPIINRLLGRPGYFRFRSDFELTALVGGKQQTVTGSTLHEMVALR